MLDGDALVPLTIALLDGAVLIATARAPLEMVERLRGAVTEALRADRLDATGAGGSALVHLGGDVSVRCLEMAQAVHDDAVSMLAAARASTGLRRWLLLRRFGLGASGRFGLRRWIGRRLLPRLFARRRRGRL